MGDSAYKAAAKAIKAKGLQKLKFYCQMCQKQCRDENGFKCHIMSEGHQRMMQVFAQNPDAFLDEFSEEFKKGFVDILRTRHATSKVMANKVYNEYIQDRHHIHMNATRWTSLTEFCKYLAEEGICRVEEGERGLTLAFLSADPDAKLRQEQQRRKELEEKNEEIRMRRLIEKQVEAAREALQAKEQENSEVREYDLSAAEPVEFKLAPTAAVVPPPVPSVANGSSGTKRKYDERLQRSDDSDQSSSGEDSRRSSSSRRRRLSREDGKESSRKNQSSKPLSNIELILEEERKKKAQRSRKDYWLRKGIVVKCINRELADGAYYKKKGNVIKVRDRYTADVQMLKSGDIVRLDQSFLETVIPKVGNKVKIVNGLNRGETATLLEVDVDNFCAQLRVDSTGELMDRVAYDDFSKLAK